MDRRRRRETWRWRWRDRWTQAALLEDHIVPRLREEHDVSLEQYDDLDPELQRKLEKY